MLELGYIKDVADIYELTYEQLMNIPGFKEKSTNNLMYAISESKSQTIDRLIFGLGIRYIGKKAAKILACSIDSIYELESMTEEQLQKLDDIGEIMARSIVDFFKREKTHTLLRKLEKANVNIKGLKEEKVSSKLKNMTICITGTISNISRDDIEKIIISNSGIVTSSVSKKTTCIIYGENAGSKLTKAKMLEIPTFTFEKFREKYLIK